MWSYAPCSRSYGPLSLGMALALALVIPSETRASSPAVEAAPPILGSLTYEAVLQAALTRSRVRERSQVAFDLVSADIDVLKHENDPRLILSGTLSEMRPPTTNLLGNTIANANRSGSTFALQLTGVLYDFGRHAARLAQSESQRELRSLSLEETSLLIRYRVARGYTMLLGAERALAVALEQVRITQDKLAQQRSNYRKGLRAESEVVASELDLGRARITMARTQAEVRSIRQSIASLMNVPGEAIAQAVVPDHLLELKPPDVWKSLMTTWGARLEKSVAEERRAKEVQALQYDEAMVSLMQRPTLSGSVTAQHLQPWMGQSRDIYLGQIQLSWDIPWSHIARDEMHRLSLRKRDLTLLGETELEDRRDLEARARMAFDDALDQWQASQEQTELAARQRKLVKSRYDTGKASALELSSAEADLLSQRLDLVKLQNTMALALIDCAEARGVTDVGGIFR